MRTFLRGMMLVTVSCWIVACGSDDNSTSSSSDVKGPNVSGPGEGKLNIVNWEGYADPSYVKAFEKQTGCKVNSVPAGTSIREVSPVKVIGLAGNTCFCPRKSAAEPSRGGW